MATTHSDVLVSALSEVPEAVVVCERDSEGTSLRQLEPERLKDMVRADLKKALVQYEGLRPVSQEPEVQESKADYVR